MPISTMRSTSSRSSGVTSTARLVDGSTCATSGATYTVRIAKLLCARISCGTPGGAHTARAGGTIQNVFSAVTRITPVTA